MSSPSSHHDNQSSSSSPGVGQSSRPSASNSNCIESITIDPPSSPTRPLGTTSTEDPIIADIPVFDKDLEESAIKLGTSVFLSAGFSTTIIGLLLSLAKDAILQAGQDFEFAMFFCFLAATCHISNVLVSGRACMQAYEHKYSQNLSLDSKRLEAITRTQDFCTWIQGLGQTLFGIAILFTLWQMIQNRILISVIYAFAAVLELFVYCVGFWRISWVESMILPISKRLLPSLCRRRETGDV